jgi:LPXTG-site transpeptidase (sortase) family protein
MRADRAAMLGEGEEILLEEEAGDDCEYRVIEQKAVYPDNVEVVEPQDGESLVSPKTCTLPDCKRRLIVQGELVNRSTQSLRAKITPGRKIDPRSR